MTLVRTLLILVGIVIGIGAAAVALVWSALRSKEDPFASDPYDSDPMGDDAWSPGLLPRADAPAHAVPHAPAAVVPRAGAPVVAAGAHLAPRDPVIGHDQHTAERRERLRRWNADDELTFQRKGF